jgi:serine/threonine-protein kinase
VNWHNVLTTLRRRKIYNVAAAYLVGAWLIIQVITQTFPFLDVPGWAIRSCILVAVAGFPVAVVAGWALDGTNIDNTTPAGRKNRTMRRRMVGLVAIASAVGVAVPLLRTIHPPVGVASDRQGETAIPAKSVAVLPFENLSTNGENAFFADGVQDEVLTYLSKIAGLKVISRTSVMQYKAGTMRDARAIARNLGVAHLLEGSVQRAGQKVRVNVQLIDAAADTHLWAQTYDRELADVFAIQSEIAEAIARQLEVKLSPSEKAAIAKPPTIDLFAYDLYTQANGLAADITDPKASKEKLPRAIALLKEAVARDPHFVAAWCLLSKLHARMYSAGYDRTPERLQQSHAAIDIALGYEPNAGEVHLALANYYYQSLRDYGKARAELAIAERKLPNSAPVFEATAYILRREGDWEGATRNLERAVSLDPQNVHTLQQLALTYQPQRRYRDQARTYDRVLALAPRDRAARGIQAIIAIDWKADLRPFQALMAELAPQGIEAVADADDINYDLCERTSAAFARGLANYPATGSVYNGVNYPHSYWEGVVAVCEGDTDRAKSAFEAARVGAAATVEKNQDFAAAVSLLALIDAGLGRNGDALREGRRACELLPSSKDALDGVALAVNLAQIYVWTGEKDLAIRQLEEVERVPNYLSYGLLKLQPVWDPVRDDGRFQALLGSLAPKD